MVLAALRTGTGGECSARRQPETARSATQPNQSEMEGFMRFGSEPAIHPHAGDFDVEAHLAVGASRRRVARIAAGTHGCNLDPSVPHALECELVHGRADALADARGIDGVET